MEPSPELLNHRISYQVIVTFDLISAQSSDYDKTREALSTELQLEKFIYFSSEDGGKGNDLPHNTLATLWRKDIGERETRTYFENEIRKIFDRLNLKGKYVVVVAQNWSAGAGNF